MELQMQLTTVDNRDILVQQLACLYLLALQ